MSRFIPLSRRWFMGALLAVGTAASAQTYPSKTIEWVVPYPAGGGTDVVERTLAEAMGKSLGQTLIINNKPGAATNIGADYVARAKADGYTIMSADTATLAVNPFLYSKLSYNVEKDFAPIGLTVRFPLILVVNPQIPAKNMSEFLAWAKAQKAPNYATPARAARTTWPQSCSASGLVSPSPMCPTGAPRLLCRTWWRARCRSCLWTPPAATSSSRAANCVPLALPAPSA